MKLPHNDTHFSQDDWHNYQLTQYTAAMGWCKAFRTSIDCGAHVGIMTHRMAERFDTVYAFEPMHHRLVRANTEAYDNVVVYPMCVSDTNGTVHIRAFDPTNSGDNRISDHGEPVESRTLDSFGFEGVDFIKMDIQGTELQALRGAQQTIRNDRPVLMLEIERDDSNRAEIHNLLASWNYRLEFKKNADHIFAPK